MKSRDKVVDLFVQNPDYTQGKIAKIAGCCLKTAKVGIGNYKTNISNARKPGSGRPHGPANPQLEKKAVKRL